MVAIAHNWLLAGVALLPPLIVATVTAGHGPVAHRLIGLQLATSLSIAFLIVLSFSFDQPSSIDLAMTLTLLTLPGTLLLILFQERWL